MSLLVYANLIFVALKIKSSKTIYTKIVNQKALVVELVDTKDLKSLPFLGVPVQVRPRAPHL
jgi:hypothetical protein